MAMMKDYMQITSNNAQSAAATTQSLAALEKQVGQLAE